MLLTFKGKGCKECPFNGITIGDFGARILTCMLSYNILLRKCSCNLDATDKTDEYLEKLKYNADEQPKDCPFAQYPNTLEIEAHDE